LNLLIDLLDRAAIHIPDCAGFFESSIQDKGDGEGEEGMKLLANTKEEVAA
jgi:hypothetical protein